MEQDMKECSQNGLSSCIFSQTSYQHPRLVKSDINDLAFTFKIKTRLIKKAVYGRRNKRKVIENDKQLREKNR